MKKSAAKKLAIVLAACLVLALAAAGCGTTGNGNSRATEIHVLSREDGSGTRSAFVELFGVEVKNADGSKTDRTVDSAEITNNTGVMMTTVAGDKNAIGYISLGSLNGTVKALPIDGVAPSVDTVKDGSYAIARPFNIVIKGTVDNNKLSPAARAFYSYLISDDAEAAVSRSGYVAMEFNGQHDPAGLTGKVVVSGSSSVSPLMEKLIEDFAGIEPGVTVELQTNDSSTGIANTAEGACDIGMSSRALKESELAKGVSETTIAMDGIAVIVNNESALGGLTTEQVAGIYTGEITNWSEIS